MNRELERIALQVFEQAMELPSDQLATFLDEACAGNAPLRQEVEALLSTRWKAGDLLPTMHCRVDSTASVADRNTDSGRAPANTNRLQHGAKLADRYEIVATLGTGGMGEVYRATDLKLDRDVAVKVLSVASLVNHQMHRRFDRETKAVAALSHPNIVTLFDVATDGEVCFAVMELVEGKTLRELISDGIGWRTVVDLAHGIASALNAAHARNIIHRDVKPENVIVSADGHAKVLDFGLARSETPTVDQDLTGGDLAPGTVPYMSPEQADSQVLECSTDIFSLGTVLFEMLTGKNPFRAASAVQTLRQVSQSNPPSIDKYVSDVPAEVTTLVMSMLRRDPQQRPTADEVVRCLSRLGQASHVSSVQADNRIRPAVAAAPVPEKVESGVAGGQPTIAVLPLQNLDSDGSHRLFGDAIAQEVIVDLSKLHWLFVIGRGSSFQFRDAATDLSEVSRVLGVRYLLTGAIEVFGDRSVVAVELSYAPDRRVVWAERFESGVDELLRLRRTITAKIVTSIETRIQMAEAEQAVRLSTENLDAWSAFHRGLWHMFRFNPDDNEIAARMFDQAIRADRHFARAHAGLSFTHFQNAFLQYSDDVSGQRDLTKRHAEKSLELDPLDPFVNLTMGRSAWLDDNLESAGMWFDRSLDLSPNYAFAWYNRALTHALLNDGEQCEKKVVKAMALSPIDPLNYAMLGTRALSHVVRGDYETAVGWAEQGIRQPTAHVHMFLIAAMANELAGRHENATQHATKVRLIAPDYSRDGFLQSFQFRDAKTLATVRTALDRLGI